MLLRILDRLEEILIASLMAAATILIFISVVHRFGTGVPFLYPYLIQIHISWAQELYIYMFIWMAKFGAALGGPIIKDKTFFFGNYEEYRRRIGAPTITTVPTDLQKQGNFSRTFTGGGAVVAVADPLTTTQQADGSYTRTVFPGNIIPASRFSTVAANVVKLFPEPALAGAPLTG